MQLPDHRRGKVFKGEGLHAVSKGKAIYQAACDAPDLEKFLAALPQKDWRELFIYLSQNYEIHGISGQVLAAMHLDAAERIMKGRTIL